MEITHYQHIYLIVGAKIARSRSEKKMSQVDLASRIGMSRASVVNIEKGRQHPPLHLLWQLADALEVELSALLPTRTEMVGNPARDMKKIIEVTGSETSAAKLAEFLNIIST